MIDTTGNAATESYEEGDTTLNDPMYATLTSWANEPKLADLKQDYEDAKPDHDSHVMDVNRWLENLNIEGLAKHKKVAGRSQIVPKLIRKQAEWRYAALSEPFLSTEDIFNTTPVTFEDRKAAEQSGLVLNNQFNTKIPKVKFIDTMVRACVDEGTVVLRTSWKFVEEEIMVPDIQPVPIEDPVIAQQIMQAVMMLKQNPAAAEQMPPEFLETVQLSMKAGQPIELAEVGLKPEMRTVVNHPNVEVCDYNNVLIDPSCGGDLEEAGFVIFSFDSNKAALEKEGKYKNLDKIETESTSILSEPDYVANDENSTFNFSDKPRKKFVVYEYWGMWDIDGDGLVKPIVAAWVGNTLIRMEENPYPDKKLPFVSIQYLPVRHSNYGQPDGELLEDNQKIVGAVTRGMMDMMGRAAVGQQGYRKDALDVTNKRKFDLGQDYAFNPTIHPQEAFYMHSFPEIPQSAGLMIQMQQNEAESMSGVKAFASGGVSGDSLGTTATGVKSAMDAVSKRELGILRRFAEGMKQVGRKFIAYNAEFLDEEEVVRITNTEFVAVKRDDLEGNIDVTLSISTAEADNEKAQELSFMLQTMGPNSDPAMVRMLQAEIAKLRKMPDLAKKLEEYQEPPPDPLAVKAQELEIAKLEAEIAKIQSETIENQANAVLDQAKAGTEQAKARQMGSDADNKDLQFVETESGVTQTRELEKAGAQANANRAMKADEHAYRMKEKGMDAVIEKNKPKTTS